MESLLSPYRALDLTEGGCAICGRILGDLGVDVIQVEKPGGSPSRNIGPFYKDIPDPQKSLFWFAYNSNKRGITLNIEAKDGQEIFRKLVKSAHFLIESSSPGYMEKMDLGYSALRKINPRIVMVSITPFGQSGPKAKHKASELTAWASGGMLYICGIPDRPPNWISFPQASLHAGAEAVIGALIAHWHREMTGEGQHVDVSIQDCIIPLLSHTPLYWEIKKYHFVRNGYYWQNPRGIRMRWTYPCKDGYIAILFMGGSSKAFMASNQALVQWMDEEGMAPEWLKDINWANDYDGEKVLQDFIDRVEAVLTEFFLLKNRAQIYDRALKNGILMAPYNTLKEVAEDEQLQFRKFWQDIHHPELQEQLRYCGPFIQMSEGRIKTRFRAPLIGEHNQEIYGQELGLSKKDLPLLKQANVI